MGANSARARAPGTHTFRPAKTQMKILFILDNPQISGITTRLSHRGGGGVEQHASANTYKSVIAAEARPRWKMCLPVWKFVVHSSMGSRLNFGPLFTMRFCRETLGFITRVFRLIVDCRRARQNCSLHIHKPLGTDS